MTQEVRIGEWIELNKTDGLLEIVSGEVELYVVCKNRRVFLCEEKAGGFLCAIPEAACRNAFSDDGAVRDGHSSGDPRNKGGPGNQTRLTSLILAALP